MATLAPKRDKTETKHTIENKQTVENKPNNWDKAAVIIQLLILVFAIGAMYLSYQTAMDSNEINQRSLEIQDRLENYPTKVFDSSSFAMGYCSYLNGSSNPVLAEGTLDATIIIISPHVIELSIESVDVQPIYAIVSDIKLTEDGRFVQDPNVLGEFEKNKFDQWSFYFETENPLRAYPYPSYQNNFTYYTRQGVNYINVSIPFNASFYLNPEHSFEVVADNISPIDLGIVTVYATTKNMHTLEEIPVPINFTTSIGIQVKILEP